MVQSLVPPNELPVPDDAYTSKDAHEILRCWVADKRAVFSLASGAFDGHRVWGVLLADAARLVAKAVAETTGGDEEAILDEIVEMFHGEMAQPTSEHSVQRQRVT